jgi:hypothetical protein
MPQIPQPTLLAIGVANPPRRTSLLDVYSATSLREAVSTIRLVCIDLMVVGLDDPVVNSWDLLQRILTVWPQQRWLLAAQDISAEEEIFARSLGALLILHGMPREEWLADYATSLRQRDSLKTFGSDFLSDSSVPASRAQISA